jgi:hypothetical protein
MIVFFVFWRLEADVKARSTANYGDDDDDDTLSQRGDCIPECLSAMQSTSIVCLRSAEGGTKKKVAIGARKIKRLLDIADPFSKRDAISFSCHHPPSSHHHPDGPHWHVVG